MKYKIITCPHCHKSRKQIKEGSKCGCGYKSVGFFTRIKRAVRGMKQKPYTPRRKVNYANPATISPAQLSGTMEGMETITYPDGTIYPKYDKN